MKKTVLDIQTSPIFSYPSISLDELPKWSPWPARLLGLEPWSTPIRDLKKIEAEYERDKYARCLEFQQANSKIVTPEEITLFQLGEQLESSRCVSVGNQLVKMPLKEALQWHNLLVLQYLTPVIEQGSVVIELGSGFGYNLWHLQQKFPEKMYVGGEYSNNAVLLAKKLFSKSPNLIVEPFNFYDLTYPLFEHINEEHLVVFTSYSIEQLPSANHFIQTLKRYRNKIDAVVHCEPVLELHDDSLLGMLRHRYAQVNDYNRDLFSLLNSDFDVKILEVHRDIFGYNPFNSMSVIRWCFAR